ncbi:MAG: tRNA (5-methylaminomethyl-2-thiouridine)(34)-methyltransferase MnmD [Loktanella sp.]|jgi:tRNA U34 5-methylaminomethyl-2-thiouridine-forming methyltransferase MnmC|nr:tRNA (5-methylaminomethyl-2-thiouridine)(34)-methyltransferase MnmD [Loktanella sp.]MDO7608310.1 tRNA (5-methylaminomethyl-2-thiouridine)(34)-methyltransferase MnmD [Loktanella sp.]MDO7622416.1 tRNA (5-methylaminomethyl-2-thiouridine)(34)-methyltransferase MnmD [Loktanella sp.]MDO7625962.1 tRNA (5-methylaminomethyl-2-thiouridine)(34)-methyltransferase MnmD [Loktanella sp.]MDO7630359.1 tRNA (5-methylaminomethyl-2-thiouridine)(34)-methyltransferase MnmD [Loktanella sp.]
MTDQTAPLIWRETDAGRVPVSTQFDDPYYSLGGGLDETRHVFLGGNDLHARFTDDLHIGELGFGTGLNLLVTWTDWLKQPHGKLHFTSFEAYPMAKSDMAEALTAFPEVAPLSSILLDKWSAGDGPVNIAENLTLEVIIGDARETLPAWQGRADAWFLDGFSPAKNPALWEPTLLQSVADHTAPNGTAATYSAAGHVRQSLTAAGFNVSRVQGFGRKRHMTTARIAHAK